MTENILVCTAWPYANGDLHIGHLAGAYLPPDIFARYHRLKGNNVLMVSGSDSHGTPITIRADAEGVSARELFERFHLSFLETFQQIGCTYDLFTHTNTENHFQVSQDIFTACLDNGYLYQHTEQQFYSETESRFLPDRYIEGICPNCGYDGARGDQCDNCKKLLEPTDLINPRSKIDGSTPVLRETEHFYLDLPRLSEEILDYLSDTKEHWRPNVINFSQQYVKDGLKGRPITRDIDWGIPLPLPGYPDKRLYVWFEAVIGYFSASIEWAKNIGQPEAWKTWWYQPESKTYYFIGKDNIPFHTIIWPGELIATGRHLYEADRSKFLNLPYDVPANEYLSMEGKKLSTSRNWAIWAPDLLERFDPDPIRFYLTAIAPETRDTDFTFEDFVRRNNDELVAAWGNLVNRVLGFAYKRYEGKVPAPDQAKWDKADDQILTEVEAGFNTVGELLAAVKLKAALEETLRLTRATNVYLDGKAPWKTIKEDPAAAQTSIFVALKVIDNLKVLFAPFLPHTCQRLHEYLGYEGQLFGRQYTQSFSETEREHVALCYDASQATGRWELSQLAPGQFLREPAPLYKKLEPEVAEQEIARLLNVER
ncbi:MAG: methionine--tRNA ligase [Chloroflexota bacterium]|nr:MAG: methionine--tRNA ligase [Chloroflexota bacterium]